MAKNLNITTANGTFTLTGSKRMKVTAKAGNLVVDVNGDGSLVKEFPLASILDYEFATPQRGGENKWLVAQKAAVECLAAEIADLRRVIADADDATVIASASLITAAVAAIESAKTRAASYAAMLAKGKDKRAAKKAAAAAPAPVVAAPVAVPDAAAVIAKVARKSTKKTAAA